MRPKYRNSKSQTEDFWAHREKASSGVPKRAYFQVATENSWAYREKISSSAQKRELSQSVTKIGGRIEKKRVLETPISDSTQKKKISSSL